LQHSGLGCVWWIVFQVKALIYSGFWVHT